MPRAARAATAVEAAALIAMAVVLLVGVVRLYGQAIVTAAACEARGLEAGAPACGGPPRRVALAPAKIAAPLAGAVKQPLVCDRLGCRKTAPRTVPIGTRLSPEAKAALATDVAARMDRALAEGKDARWAALEPLVTASDLATLRAMHAALAPTQASLGPYLEASRALQGKTDDPLGIVAKVLTELRQAALTAASAGASGPDRAFVEAEASRAAYELAKLVVDRPSTPPGELARARDVIRAYEGRTPTFESYAEQRAALEEGRRAIEADLRAAGNTAAARELERAKKKNADESAALEEKLERDVVRAAEGKAKRLPEAERAAVWAEARAQLGAVKVAPLRAAAEAAWAEARTRDAEAGSAARAAELVALQDAVKGLDRRVTELEYVLTHYMGGAAGRDARVMTAFTRDGKLVPRAEVAMDLALLRAQRDREAFRLASLREEHAANELAAAKAWRAFYAAEIAAQKADLHVAELGLGDAARHAPTHLEGTKYRAAVEAYFAATGQTSDPRPAALRDRTDARVRTEAQAVRNETRLGEAERKIQNAAKERERAEKARNASELEEAVAMLGPPPPPATFRVGWGTAAPAPPVAGTPSKPRPDGPPKTMPMPRLTISDAAWDRGWEHFTRAVARTSLLPRSLEPYVAELGKALAESAEAFEKWNRTRTDADLAVVDARIARARTLQAELRARGVAVDDPGLSHLFRVTDALLEAQRQQAHFAAGADEEAVATVTGLVALLGKLLRFQNDPAYRDDVKETLDLLRETDRDEATQRLCDEVEETFQKDPARASGRVTMFVATFFIPLDQVIAAFASLARSMQRLAVVAVDAGKDLRLLAGAARAVGRDLARASTALEGLAAESAKLARSSESLFAEARTLRAAGKETEAAAKLAEAESTLATLRRVARAADSWSSDAERAVRALESSGADAQTLATAKKNAESVKATSTALAEQGKKAESVGTEARAFTREATLRELRRRPFDGAVGEEASTKTLAKDLTPAERARLEQEARELRRIAGGLDRDPMAVGSELRRGTFGFPVVWGRPAAIRHADLQRIAAEAAELSKAHGIAASDARALLVDEAFGKLLGERPGHYFHDPKTNTVHAPSSFEVVTPGGQRRPLDANDPIERLFAERHARAQVEEFAHGAGSIRPGEYAPLDPKLLAFRAWLDDPGTEARLARSFTRQELHAAKEQLHEAEITELFRGKQSDAEMHRYKVREVYQKWIDLGEPKAASAASPREPIVDTLLSRIARTDPARAKAAAEGWARLRALGEEPRGMLDAFAAGKVDGEPVVDFLVKASQRTPDEVSAALVLQVDAMGHVRNARAFGTYPESSKLTESLPALQKAGVPAGVPIRSEYGIAREMVLCEPTLTTKARYTWHAEKVDSAIRSMERDLVTLRRILPELERVNPAEAARARTMLADAEARIAEMRPFVEAWQRRHLDYPHLWEVKDGRIVPKRAMPFDPTRNGPARLPNPLPGEKP